MNDGQVLLKFWVELDRGWGELLITFLGGSVVQPADTAVSLWAVAISTGDLKSQPPDEGSVPPGPENHHSASDQNI